MRPITRHLRLLGLLALAGVPGSTATAQDRLLPQSRRITDEAIARDRSLIASWQARAAALATPPQQQYARTRATALLAFAGHEYDRNNRGLVVDSAFAEGVDLVTWLEGGPAPLDRAGEPPGLDSLAPGLWRRLDSLRAADRDGCAGAAIAEAQVLLLVAREEAVVGGRVCALPPVRRAEALADEAAALIEACKRPPRDTGAAPPPVIAGPDQEPVRLVVPDAVHFAFDRASLGEASVKAVDQVADVLHALPGTSVRLDAFTDRQGAAPYNRNLAARRGDAVKARLVEAGIESSRISVVARGSGPSLVEGQGALERNAHDRRVEFTLAGKGSERVRVERQREDVQVSPDRRQPGSRRRADTH